MAKRAHIINPTGTPEVGVRALALCGKEFKVKQNWDDIPRDKPICRDCTDLAIAAMTEADHSIAGARARLGLLELAVNRLQDLLNPSAFLLDEFTTDADEFDQRRAAKAEKKAEKKRAKSTCTCSWTDPETFTEDPDCPIHGKKKGGEDEPIAPNGDTEGSPL